MFGRRSDGVELKTMPAEFKLMPMLMKERSDSQVFFNQDVPIAAIEEYISKKNEEGIRITLIDVVFAGIVRILGQRPALNRFAENGTDKTADFLSKIPTGILKAVVKYLRHPELLEKTLDEELAEKDKVNV